MRQIKFRGKTRYGHNWVFGYVVVYDGDVAIIHEEETYQKHAVYCSTLGQFTGLKDKNGREIYEGDVMEITDLAKVGEGYIMFEDKVYFDNGTFYIGYGWLSDHNEHSQVVGTIHDQTEKERRGEG